MKQKKEEASMKGKEEKREKIHKRKKIRDAGERRDKIMGGKKKRTTCA